MRRFKEGFTILVVAAVVAAALETIQRREHRPCDERHGSPRRHSEAVGEGGRGTLDPLINYTLQYWQLYQATYDGLLGFKKAGGDAAFTVVPDLADAMPKPTNGGKTWVFKLRKGIKFSNGKPVTPTTSSRRSSASSRSRARPPGSFYAGIVGADGLPEDAGDLHAQGRRHRRTTQPSTVTINLDGARPRVQVQARRPAREHPAGGRAAEGRRHEADPRHRRRTTSRRTTRTSSSCSCATRTSRSGRQDAQPAGYPDQITQSLRPHRRGAVTAIENGQADWTLEPPPADRLNEIGTKYASQVHVNPLTAFWYVPMNTNLAPFNNLKARQAVNYAVDRNAAVKLFGGTKLAHAVVPGAAARLPRAQATTARTPRTRARSGRRRTWRRRSSSSRSPAPPARRSTVVVPDDEVEQGDRRLPPERAQPDRLQGERQADLAATSSSPTSRTRRTRCRSTCSSGTRTTRRRRTS